MRTAERKLDPREMDLLSMFQIHTEPDPRAPGEGNTLARFTGPSIRDWGKAKALFTSLGFHWNRGLGAFRFTGLEGAGLVHEVLRRGVIFDPKELEFFETPQDLAARMARLALERRPPPGRRVQVLEPSAGKGALVWALANHVDADFHVFELNTLFQKYLVHKAEADGIPLLLLGSEFKDQPSRVIVDLVVMNPPFSQGQDAKHIMWAYRYLRPGGRLVSVASAALGQRSRVLADSEDLAFQGLVDLGHARINPLPDGTFKRSGTNVRTVLAIIDKPC